MRRAIDGFALDRVKFFDEISDDSQAFAADITYHGCVVGKATNDGNGGGNMHRFENRIFEDRYLETARRHFPEATYEPMDYLDEALLLRVEADKAARRFLKNGCAHVFYITDGPLFFDGDEKPYGFENQYFLGFTSLAQAEKWRQDPIVGKRRGFEVHTFEEVEVD